MDFVEGALDKDIQSVERAIFGCLSDLPTPCDLAFFEQFYTMLSRKLSRFVVEEWGANPQLCRNGEQ
jgi:hypothetical protein